MSLTGGKGTGFCRSCLWPNGGSKRCGSCANHITTSKRYKEHPETFVSGDNHPMRKNPALAKEIGNKLRGRPLSAATRKKLRQVNLGKHLSEVTRKKIGIGLTVNGKPCLHCGQLTNSKTDYCSVCGNKAVKPCPDCGKLIHPASGRCNSCGQIMGGKPCLHCGKPTTSKSGYCAGIGGCQGKAIKPCPDCGKLIWLLGERCASCANIKAQHNIALTTGKPCLHCKTPTISKTGYCDKCLNSKIKPCPGGCGRMIAPKAELCGSCVKKGERNPTRIHPELGKVIGRKNHESGKLAGDNNYFRKHPEKLLRGDDHWSRKHPELCPRGDRHGSHTKPEKRPRGSKNGAWRGGLSFCPYPPEFNGALKRYILDRDGHACQFPGCGVPENGRKHTIHHIDNVKEHTYPANLTALCCSHNNKVEKDRDYWTFYFQEKWRERLDKEEADA